MSGGAFTESPLVKRSGWLRLRAWIVCAAGMIVVLIGGSVTTRMSFGVAAVTLATPVAIFVGFAVAEWREARRTRVVLPRGHLAGPGLAVVLWFLNAEAIRSRHIRPTRATMNWATPSLTTERTASLAPPAMAAPSARNLPG
jgi:hypothetical protein